MIYYVMKTGNYFIRYTILQLNTHERQWKLKPNGFKSISFHYCYGIDFRMNFVN